MAYNPTEQQQIIDYVTNLVNGGGTAADIVNAANQYGVPIDEVSKLFGIGTEDANSIIASQPLTGAQVQQGRDFINDAIGRSGPGYQFNGDFTGQDRFLNRYLAAGQDALGLSDAAVAQILGPNVTADHVGTFQKSFDSLDPRITNMYGNMFRQDAGMPLVGGTSQTSPASSTPATPWSNLPADFDMREGPPMWMQGGYGSYNQQNPYLSDMSAVLQGQINRNLTENMLPAIRSEYRMLGGQGGSRQGIAEGMALRGANEGLSNALTNMYYGDYNNSMNRGLQRYGMDQNAFLGWNGLQNQRYGMDQNFWTAQRGQDLQTIGLGANLYGLGMQDPWNSITNAGNVYNTAAGNTGSQTNSSSSGGGAAGAFGGALTGLSLYNSMNNPYRGYSFF